MSRHDYLDFDLAISPAGAEYRAEVRSPGGDASGTFRPPFTDQELDGFWHQVESGRSHGGWGPPPPSARDFGQRLFDSVFHGGLRDCLVSSLGQVEEQKQERTGLRIRLRLTDAPELGRLPWEYLYHGGRFLAQSIQTPVVRYLNLAAPVEPLAVEPPLRVLVMISAPPDVPALQVEEEYRQLVRELARAGDRVVVERVQECSLPALLKVLRGAEYHVFHFIGHGVFDTGAGDGMLLMEGGTGGAREVSARQLGTVLHDERTLRLVVINACEGARGSRHDPFAGTAQALIQQGIPAVIAMQCQISDQAALTLSSHFYAALADGYPVDAALAEARKAVSLLHEMEWGTPVLYMRAEDGHLFHLAPPGGAGAPAAAVPALPAPEPAAADGPAPAPAPRPWLRKWRVAAAAAGAALVLAAGGYLLWPGRQTAAYRDTLFAVVDSANRATVRALRTGDTTALGRYYMGAELVRVVRDVKLLAQEGQYREDDFQGRKAGRVRVARDTLTAQADVRETWTQMTYDRATGRCLYGFTLHDVPQTVNFRRRSGVWKIENVYYEENVSQVPEPCPD